MAKHHDSVHVLIEVDGTSYDAARCTMHEALFEVGGLSCEFTDDAGAPEPSALLGKPATLTIQLQDESIKREYVGIVVEAVRCADRDQRPMVRAHIAPRLWKLTKRTNCRIFQEMSTLDIVSQVLDEAGVTDYEWVGGDFDPRVYCCQYRESDFEFIARLLFEEGIYFSVVHVDGVDKVIFCDDGGGIGDIEPSPVQYVTLQGFGTLKPHVTWLEQTHAVRSDKVTQRDYDFIKPKFQPKGEAESEDDGAHSLEVYNYPGRFDDEAVGTRYAQALLESMQAERDVLSGQTALLSLKCGHRITIEEHPYEPFNQEWLVTHIDTSAHNTLGFEEKRTERDYVCRFTAVPTARTKYRAPRRAVTADVPGMQTAFTTGPGGSEIHPDEHGRVKVRFHWDRTDPSDDTSSCWLRTEQPNTPDSMLLPRVGWEVQVRYIEGDVDRPVCLGRMYHALAPPPYALPDYKARSSLQTNTSPGGGSSNEMRMDDSGGAEEFFINASKDLSINVKNNMTLTIGNNETREIGSNHTVSVTNSTQHTVGSNQTIDIGGDQNVKVETFMVDDVGGNHTLEVGGNRDLKVGGDHKHTVTGNTTQDVGANQADIVVGAVEEKADGNWDHDVGTAMVEITGGSRSFTVAGNHTEDIGAAKIVATWGGRGVEVSGNLTTKVAGAIVNKVSGDKSNKAGGSFTDLVAGAQIIKAKNVTFEGEDLVAVVMGASTLIVSKPAVLIAGTSVKWDGVTKDTAALIVDN